MSGYPREASPLDDSALLYLYPLADKDLLARIRNARLPQSYFECMLQALQSSFIYDRLIISWVNELPQPELAAEVVDFLIRFEEVDWAVCARRLRGQADSVGARGGRRTRGRARCCGRWSASWAEPAATIAAAGGTIPLPSTSASADRADCRASCAAACSRRCTSKNAGASASCHAGRCCRTCKPERAHFGIPREPSSGLACHLTGEAAGFTNRRPRRDAPQIRAVQARHASPRCSPPVAGSRGSRGRRWVIVFRLSRRAVPLHHNLFAVRFFGAVSLLGSERDGFEFPEQRCREFYPPDNKFLKLRGRAP